MGNSSCCSKVSTTTTTTFDVREKKKSKNGAVTNYSFKFTFSRDKLPISLMQALREPRWKNKWTFLILKNERVGL